MPWYTLPSRAALCVAALAILVAGCGPQSPEERVAAARAQYIVDLKGWMPQEPEPVDVMEEALIQEGEAIAEAAEASAMAAEATAEAVEEYAEEGEEGIEEGVEEETGPRTVDVLFDIIVRFNGSGTSLPGITAEVIHSDPLDEEKATYRAYIDTAGMAKGESRQLDFVLEGLEVEEGDGFAVDLVEGVPADLGEYREFSEPSP